MCLLPRAKQQETKRLLLPRCQGNFHGNAPTMDGSVGGVLDSKSCINNIIIHIYSPVWLKHDITLHEIIQSIIIRQIISEFALKSFIYIVRSRTQGTEFSFIYILYMTNTSVFVALIAKMLS
jgi:hypothetical protein